MSMVKLTLKDIEKGSEQYIMALQEATKRQLNDWVNMDIELNKVLKLVSINEENCDLSIDLPFEEGWLISYATDLDYCCYDCITELWNDIVEDEDLISQYNMTDVYDESLLFLFGEIEDEIMSLSLDTTMDLTKEINIDQFIDNYKYKNLVDVKSLKDSINKGLKGLQKMISNDVKNYFESDEYYEMINSIEFAEIDYFYEEINKKGFVEVYI